MVVAKTPTTLLTTFFILINTQHSRTAPTTAAPAIEDTQLLQNCNKQNLLELPDIGAITELVARECNIHELENAFFIRFSSLVALEINDSGLTTLQDYALHSLKHLKTLSLVRNNISEVKSWSNEHMTALISLDLRRNSIKELTSKSFFRYPNLQRLNLAVNLLEDIDDGIFNWMPHLKYLNLGKNRLKIIEERYFHGMHRLSYLALHNNELKDIEESSFETNTHLRSLRLEGNKLVELDFLKVKSLVRLIHLNLSHNAIETLEKLTFSKDYELTGLDLSFNYLTEVLLGTFSGLESLEHLNISHNRLNSIEAGSLSELNSLLHIDLSHNNLSNLPMDIFKTTSLMQHINLANNTLHTLNGTLFNGMPHLIELNLSANKLGDDDFIENLAFELNRAELILDLSDNQFQLVNISSLIDFRAVELAGNRWSCKWLIQEMLRIPQSIHFERKFAVVTAWSSALLDVSGIDCYDVERQRSIVILDTGRVWVQQHAADCESALPKVTPTIPQLYWPKIPSDKFDSRSVIIWMLIAIALAFSGLRIGRQLIEQKEHKKKLKAIRDAHVAQNMENEKLSNELSQP